MDSRLALKPDTLLRFVNSEGGIITYTIIKEIGRGGSCIVYEANYKTNTGDLKYVRIKECYPYKLNISRDDSGVLCPHDNDCISFEQEKNKIIADFSLSNDLFYSDGLHDAIVNTIDVYSYNNTVYIVSVYSSDKTLAVCKPASIIECIHLVREVSYILDKIHKKGYLYLDIKPENILFIEGLQGRIQLFDFDSLFPLSAAKMTSGLKANNVRLSYSKGFAPIEVQMSKLSRIGPHSDVFGVGALLFYLLFGSTPAAPDCESDADYDYSKITYDVSKCDDKLTFALTEFFHHDLANYCYDRYQSMQEASDILCRLEKYADLSLPRIYSTVISQPRCIYGREKDLEEIGTILAGKDNNCLSITGMGGIGKSTLIREYLRTQQKKYDTCLYLNFNQSIEKTITDDNALQINTVEKADAEDIKVYFKRKLRRIRELIRDKNVIIVIDNYSGAADKDLLSVLELGWKVVIISRQTPQVASAQLMNISAVSDIDSLCRIFETNLGRGIERAEIDSVKNIIRKIAGHTLVLELLAKQIARSHLTISQASILVSEYGFSSIGNEKVSYEKDRLLFTDTIGNIIDAIFKSDALSEDEKVIMKIASLLGVSGIDILQFHSILHLDSFNEINELIDSGWLTLENDRLSMHPVIQETVAKWRWTDTYKSAAAAFLNYFYKEIRLEATKNNYPKKLRDLTMTGKRLTENYSSDNCIYKAVIKWQKRFYNRHGIAGAAAGERQERINDLSSADIPKLAAYLKQAEEISEQCGKLPDINKSESYLNLLYVTVLNTPRYNEEYLLAELNRIFEQRIYKFVRNGSAELLDDYESRNPISVMELYRLAESIYIDQRNYPAMVETVDKAWDFAKRIRTDRIYALYYDLQSDYYDAKLNGAYDAETPDEATLLEKLMTSVYKTIQYAKKAKKIDDNHLYIKNILAKATILIRSERGNKTEISRLIDKAKTEIDENTLPYAIVRYQYFMVCGWYYAITLGNPELTERAVRLAGELYAKIAPTDLDEIDDSMIPCANIYLELQMYKQAGNLIYDGIKICEKHGTVAVYVRKKLELYGCLLDIGYMARNYELCRNIIATIDYENEKNRSLGISKTVQDSLRTEVMSNLM